VNDQSLYALDQGRPSAKSISAPRDLRSDLPSWCPDWSVAGRESDEPFHGDGDGWRASVTKKFVCTRPSRTTLALKGLVVSRLNLCSDSIMRQVGNPKSPDCHPISYMPWHDRSENLRAFLKLQGLEIDHGAMGAILKIFQRMTPPELISRVCEEHAPRNLRSLLCQAHPNDLVALLVPVFLIQADPELFRMTRLEIDARIPPEDYYEICYMFRYILNDYGAGTRLFVTENGMQGAGYPGVREGDLVCIIHGRNAPQILRQVNADDHYILVGACNVDGLMYGEGFEMGLTEREFILV
jgi:hypothetical protein